MSSKRHSDAEALLDWRIPTTEADIRMLRRCRETPRPWPLTRLNRLTPIAFFAVGPRRAASSGEPFRL